MTKEEIIEIAKTCKNKTYFRTMYRRAAYIASKNGWYEEVSGHIPRNQLAERRRWSDQQLLEVALKYKTVKELMANDPTVRIHISKRGLDNTHLAHMTRLGNISNKFVYAIENFCKKEVYVGLSMDPHQRLIEHRKRNAKLIESFGHSSFEISRTSDIMSAKDAQITEGEWINHYQTHGWKALNSAKAGALGANFVNVIDKDEVDRRSLSYSTMRDFQKNESYAYGKAVKYGWIDDIGKHLTRRKTLSKAVCHAEALKWKTRGEFQTKGNRSAYMKALKTGWLDEICAHMKTRRIITSDEAFRIVKDYTKRSEFQKADPSAYAFLLRHGLLNEACSHMRRPDISVNTPDEALKERAMKFETRGEFLRNDANAYHAARRRGILNDVCAHMPKRANNRKK